MPVAVNMLAFSNNVCLYYFDANNLKNNLQPDSTLLSEGYKTMRYNLVVTPELSYIGFSD